MYGLGWTIHLATTEKTMERRKFLVGLGSASIGGSALVGSGAFSRVESQRGVTIQVAEDPDAYLGMDKCSIDGSETPNSSYADLDGDGHLEILMNPDNPTIGESPLGEGINSNSRMWVDNVFQICNQGKEDVCVYIEDDGDWPYAPEPYEDERRVDFYLGDDRDGSIVGEDHEFLLELGECVCIGLKTNSKGLSEGDELLDDLDNEIRIIADVDCGDEPQIPGEENGEENGLKIVDGRGISFIAFCPADEDDLTALDPTITPIARKGDDELTGFEWDSGEIDVSEVIVKAGTEWWICSPDNETFTSGEGGTSADPQVGEPGTEFGCVLEADQDSYSPEDSEFYRCPDSPCLGKEGVKYGVDADGEDGWEFDREETNLECASGQKKG